MTLFARVVCSAVVLYASHAFADPELDSAAQVSAGSTHSCAVMTDGTATCWGDNSSGQLGDGGRTSHSTAVPVRKSAAIGDYLDHVTQIVAASGFTCVLRDDERVLCWGQNNLGKLGTGDVGVGHLYPTLVDVGVGVRTLSGIGESMCALLDNTQRSVRCWGRNGNGQLGDGTLIDRSVPTDVVITERDGSKTLLTSVSAISAGSNHTCAVLGDTSVACWGFNWLGELGDGTYVDSTSPVGVVVSTPARPALSDIDAITANGVHTCARFASTWLIACWGNNTQGQLGYPAVTWQLPSPVGVSLGVRSIGAGFETTCAMLADYRVACWGSNYYGQLGNGTTTPSRVPVIQSSKKVTQLSVGNYHACAVMPDTTITCWGQGTYGEIGNGLRNERNPSPVPVLGTKAH